ncbi:unnamed protein product [Auanema sp. JU1783]|nr:unnamed protein product [Auanema sp. JU1783]
MTPITLYTLCIFLFLIPSTYSSPIGCLPERINYRSYYPCYERNSEEDERAEAIFTGQPTRLAKTGFYDRLFRTANTIQWQGKYAYYPTYGFNPNLPTGVYRYSNFFTKPVDQQNETV